MAKLILSMDGLVLKEIPLTKERTTIGRKASNDIQIDNLAVSGEHAVIVTIMNDSFLEDLGSTNGTIVNGNPVKKHFLQNNDVVELGKYKLKFLAEPGAAPAAAADFEKTMVLRPSAMKAAAEQARAAGGAQSAEQARAAAVVQAAKAATSTGTADKDAKTCRPGDSPSGRRNRRPHASPHRSRRNRAHAAAAGRPAQASGRPGSPVPDAGPPRPGTGRRGSGSRSRIATAAHGRVGSSAGPVARSRRPLRAP